MTRKLSDNVIYIGSDDLDIDLFESQYIVPEGVSYNSYLILDRGFVLAARGADRQNREKLSTDALAKIKRTKQLASVAGNLICWGMTVTIPPEIFGLETFEGISLEGRTLAVKEGDVLELGAHKLQFIGAPMVHWPEVLMSFDPADGALYSADGFGKFGALSKCGFYGRDDDDWACEARRYYFNIVGKYGAQVQQVLKKAAALPIRTIRPLHGPILEDNLGEYIRLYDIWSRYEPETDGIFIAVASIHGGTMEAAQMLAQILQKKGAPKVVVSDLSRSDIAENVEDAFRYPKTVFAAASYDAGLFSPMYDFIHRLQIKGWSKRKAGLLENGSWAPSAGRVMKEMLSQMKDVEIAEPVVTIRSRMKSSDFPALDALADAILAL